MNLSDDLISFEYPLGSLFFETCRKRFWFELTQTQNLWTAAYWITGLFSGLALSIKALSFKNISSRELSIELDLLELN